MEIELANRFTALSHPKRLSVLRLLLRRYPDHVPAGEVAAALDLKPNTLSPYLATLLAADLVTQRRAGTSLGYAADPAGLRGLLEVFLAECCQGRPDLCLTELSLRPLKKETNMPYRTLFICTGNSARSIFAETLLRDLGGDRFDVHSAGTKPESHLNPLAVAMLEIKNHDTGRLRAKNVAEYQGAEVEPFDFVFTVCDRAANEACPTWAGQPLTGHWSTPDPVKAEGNEAERMLAFQSAYGMLRNRIEAFIALPIEMLDRLSLKTAVDDIARQSAPGR